MIIQVQREGGLQSRTFVLSARQVRVLRFLTSRSGKLLAAGSAVIIAFLLIESIRVPALMVRISRMEHTATQLDTLEHSLSELQRRYDQVRTMMGANSHEGDGETPAGAGPSGLAIPAGSRRSAALGVQPDGRADAGMGGESSPTSSAPGVAGAGSAVEGDGGAVEGSAADTASTVTHRRRRRANAVVPADSAAPTKPDTGLVPNPQAVPE